RGFGSTVIERSVRHDLQGDVTLSYKLDGLRARFSSPGTQFRPAATPASTIANPASGSAATEGQHVPQDVLLVEDMMIIALDAEEMLREMGVATVRVASSVAQALKDIADRAPGFALLDVNLGMETSFEIAERLADLNVRFAFATGYGDQLAFPPRFEQVPKLRKPYTAQSMKKILVI
ncbi:MAG TPA: hybrid sensor histidine kinase/response regulator, partial [Hyphomicrobiaceae bacterium]